jgi:hypothetical protein
MKHLMITAVGAAMLAFTIGTANAAYENDLVPNQSASPEAAGCANNPNLCVDSTMTNDSNQMSQPDADVGLRLGQQDEAMNQDLEEEDSDVDEQASAEEPTETMIIILQ